jgi:hypothetical protein
VARALDRKTRYILDHYLKPILAGFAPAEIWLWGSRVYGHPHEYSDVDMIVVSPQFEGLSFFQRRARFREVTGVADDPSAEVVDALCYTPEEFAELRSGPTVIREAVEKGVRVA